MENEDQIHITDPEGILILLAVVLIYLGIRLLPRFLVGFRNFIPAAEVKRRLDAGDNLLLVDVRSRSEFAGELGHVRGSLNVPLPELAARLKQDAALMDDGRRTVVATSYIPIQMGVQPPGKSPGTVSWYWSSIRSPSRQTRVG